MGVHCTPIENLYAHTNVRPWAYMGVHGRTWAYIVRPQKIVGIFLWAYMYAHVRQWAYNYEGVQIFHGRTWAYKGVHGRDIAGARLHNSVQEFVNDP